MSDKQEEPETPGVLDPNDNASLTREALYELVWSEPMLEMKPKNYFLSHQLRVITSTGFLVRIFMVRAGYGRVTI